MLPSVLPELFIGIRLAIGFAWTTIVAAETVDGIPGIGGLAWSTKKFQQTDVAVLCIIVIGITAILLDQLVKAVERARRPLAGQGLTAHRTHRPAPVASAAEHPGGTPHAPRSPDAVAAPPCSCLGARRPRRARARRAGCGDDDDDSSPDADHRSRRREAPDKIMIGYQAIPNGDLVVKNEGWLEEAFPDTEIEWKLFDSGGSVNEAIVGGSIDIGLAG